MTPRVQIVNQPQFKRALRNPQHDFNLKVRPWQVQPCMIAPVLAGETMKNLMLMSRVVTDPIRDKLMGWHCEYYFFYIKHRDLDQRDGLTEMHLSGAIIPDASFGALVETTATDPNPYFTGRALNYQKQCLNKVIEWYFRDEGDATPHTIDGVPIAKLNRDGWWQSAKLTSEAVPTDHELPGENPQRPDGIPAGFETAYTQWEMMVAASLTEATFEDYLRSHGVRVPDSVDEELHRPELIRYVRKWAYPANTVEPTTGEPSSAVMWSVAERASKDRFFSEPGFLFGVQVVRPKVNLAGIKGSAVGYMNKYSDWLPAILQDLPFTALQNITPGGTIVPTPTSEQWFDLKDLFLYGEQFRNHDLSRFGNPVALPDANAEYEFAKAADALALFVDQTAKYHVWSDGVVQLNIASPVHKDTSG